MPVNGRPATARRYYDRTALDQLADLLALDDVAWYWRRHNAPPAVAVFAQRPVVLALHRLRCLLVEHATNRFDRFARGRIVRIDQYLRDHGDDIALDARALQRVLQRLLDHVTNPACGSGHQDAERQRRQHTARHLVAVQLITDLRTIAVHDRDTPTRVRHRDDRRQALARVGELLVNVPAFALAQERVATQCYDDRPGGLQPANSILASLVT